MFSSTMLSVSKTRSGIEGASILLTKSSISISFSRLSTQYLGLIIFRMGRKNVREPAISQRNYRKLAGVSLKGVLHSSNLLKECLPLQTKTV